MPKDLFLEWVALPCKVSAAFGYMLVIPTGFLLHEEIFLLITKRSSVLPGEHKKPTHVINGGGGVQFDKHEADAAELEAVWEHKEKEV